MAAAAAAKCERGAIIIATPPPMIIKGIAEQTDYTRQNKKCRQGYVNCTGIFPGC